MPPVKGFVDKIRKHERDRVGRETCSTTVTRMRWRWSGWSRIWKAWPELLHDAADSGLTSPMATFSAHTASPPPPSRTPAGPRASSRHASIAPRTTSAHGPLAWAGQIVRLTPKLSCRVTEAHLPHEYTAIFARATSAGTTVLVSFDTTLGRRRGRPRVSIAR